MTQVKLRTTKKFPWDRGGAQTFGTGGAQTFGTGGCTNVGTGGCTNVSAIIGRIKHIFVNDGRL